MSRTVDDRARLTFVIVASLTALGVAAAASAQGQAPAPSTPTPGAWPSHPGEGFTGWRQVKSGASAAVFGKPAGTHHIYANPAAVEGYRTGVWADGAVLVFDVLEDGAPGGAATDPARRLRTDAMVRDRARFAATDGWGYGSWLAPGATPNPPVAADAARVCHACHKARQPDDFVFSELAD